MSDAESRKIEERRQRSRVTPKRMRPVMSGRRTPEENLRTSVEKSRTNVEDTRMTSAHKFVRVVSICTSLTAPWQENFVLNNYLPKWRRDDQCVYSHPCVIS